ncbi:hypothetical protein [Vibrio rhodolitus]|uniref:hypothetical protein n=1 Tax=Vibrio rhodolitus TaxID=2231649 RepID=UPI000F4D9777|nr:hypothetical protein [Vibrio rhodolitus]
MMTYVYKLFLLVFSCTFTSMVQASTITGSTVNVMFSVTFIKPAFEVSLPTLVDFGSTVIGQRERIDRPFGITFSSEGNQYDSFHDAPSPVVIFAQNITSGAQDAESVGNMQQFFYLGCDNGSVLTKITTTPVQLDTLAVPIHDLTTCKLYMDTNPEASPGEVTSTLNFTVKYP